MEFKYRVVELLIELDVDDIRNKDIVIRIGVGTREVGEICGPENDLTEEIGVALHPCSCGNRNGPEGIRGVRENHIGLAIVGR